jgi:predicted AAA+ superfamily ATPase
VSVSLVNRPLYLDRIEPFMDAPVVKVLTGLRRSGKSRLLELVAQRLHDRGIPQERIVHLNFDSLESTRCSVTPDRRLPGVLENIVWLELRRRGYDVTVGKIGPTEVDFAARRQEDTIYVQVATTIASSAETRRREYAPLEAIADNYPKYVITLDPLAGDNTDGIHHLPIYDFLLSDAY